MKSEFMAGLFTITANFGKNSCFNNCDCKKNPSLKKSLWIVSQDQFKISSRSVSSFRRVLITYFENIVLRKARLNFWVAIKPEKNFLHLILYRRLLGHKVKSLQRLQCPGHPFAPIYDEPQLFEPRSLIFYSWARFSSEFRPGSNVVSSKVQAVALVQAFIYYYVWIHQHISPEAHLYWNLYRQVLLQPKYYLVIGHRKRTFPCSQYFYSAT